MAGRTRRATTGSDTWAGFVDALSTLLMVLIFALVVFMLAQFFQGIALSGRDRMLAELEDMVAELSGMLALERDASADLREEVGLLSSQLLSTSVALDDAEQALALLAAERDELVTRLTTAEDEASRTGSALDEANARIAVLQEDLDRALQDVAVTEETLSLKLAELASLQRDIDTLDDVRRALEAEVGRMTLALDETLAERTALIADLGAERDRSMELEARLSDEAERTLLAQKEVDERDIRLTELALLVTMTQEERDAAERIGERRLAQIAIFNQQLQALRSQIAALNAVLDAAEAQAEADKVRIARLSERLNLALAAKVQELSRYRSAFLEKLVDVLGDRRDIKIVGDRFVLQAELLFDSGSARIAEDGTAELDKIARLIRELVSQIPNEVNWVLRVDGHTDTVPISTPLFPTNWELSTARATSVVRYLIGQGVPAHRLMAAGFGEYQPIDTIRDEIGARRNRRIEFKLTER